jgi:hypothetical protein
MKPEAFIASARKLLSGQPSPVDLRRAVSTSYYGIFHHVSQWIFAGIPTNGSWLSVYRGLEHKKLIVKCGEAQHANWGFSRDILTYANAVISSQKERIAADYDPTVSISANDALHLVDTVEQAIMLFDAAPSLEQRKFVMFIFIVPRKP